MSRGNKMLSINDKYIKLLIEKILTSLWSLFQISHKRSAFTQIQFPFLNIFLCWFENCLSEHEQSKNSFSHITGISSMSTKYAYSAWRCHLTNTNNHWLERMKEKKNLQNQIFRAREVKVQEDARMNCIIRSCNYKTHNFFIERIELGL